MSAIVGYSPAYAPDGSGGVNPQRVLGMKLLGQYIIEAVTGTPDAAKLSAALSKAMANGVDLRFVNVDTGNGVPLKVKSIGSASGVNIVCPLVDANNAAAGELKLVVKNDSSTGTGSGKKFDMNVIFPDQADNASGLGVYLEIAAKDTYAIAAITPPTTVTDEAKNYLAAFKFLSRCK